MGVGHKDWAAFLSLHQQKSPTAKAVGLFWQGHKDLNPEPTVLETRLINQPLGDYF